MPDSTSALVNQLANPPSPFDMLQKGVGAVTALKDLQAKQAIANAYTQSIDPDTGQVDQGKFNTLMRGGAASWAAGPAMQQQGQAQGAQGTGTQNWVDAQRDQLNLLNGYAAPLLQRANAGQQVSADDVRSVLNNAVGITPQMRQAVETKLASLPPGGDAGGLLKGFQFATQSGGEQASRLYPTVGQSFDMGQYLGQQTTWKDPDNPNIIHEGTNADRLRAQGVNPDTLLKAFGSGGFGPGAGGTTSGAPASGQQPPTAPGSSPGAGNWEVQHNNFAGMRNPNVPAAGGPNTNPSGWQQFDTPEAGVQAISNQLDRYASGATTGKPLTTLNEIISTWAPPSDGNPTPTLVARASKIVGVGPDTPLDLSDPNTKAKLVEAMIRNEQGGALPQAAAAAIPKVFGGTTTAGGAPVPQPPPSPERITLPSESNLVPGGVAQLPAPPVQLADASGGFPQGRTVTYPSTLPETTGASGKQYQADLASYNELPKRLTSLTQAADILRANPTLGTGTGAGDIQKLASLAQNFGFTLSPQANTNLAAFTELNKDLERYYLNLGGASNRSDLAQIETKMSQPSTEMQRQALEDLIPRTIGLERANSAPYLKFVQQYGASAPKYVPQYQAQAAAYRNAIDPVAFGFNYMTTQQRKAYLDSLPDTEKQKYLNSLREASQLYNIPLTSAGR